MRHPHPHHPLWHVIYFIIHMHAHVAPLSLIPGPTTCSHLMAVQVEAIREAAQPYTQSVRKVGRRLSLAVDEAIVRYSSAPRSRTRSHFKKA